MTHHNAAEVLQELETMATNLANRKCPYLAALVLQYYDGDYAAETKEVRLQAARKYLDQAREQPPYQPPAAKVAPKA